mgnify:CR=1 FL=1
MAPFKIGSVCIGLKSEVFLIPRFHFLRILTFKENSTDTRYAFHVLINAIKSSIRTQCFWNVNSIFILVIFQ